MAERTRPRSDQPAKGPPTVSFPFDVDDAIVEIRTTIDDGLLEYLNSRLSVFGDAGLLSADLSDGLLISVLKLIAPDGKYPMEEGRFWQLLDRHNPFSPSRREDTVRARLTNDVESMFVAAQNERFEDGFDSALSLELLRLVLRHGGATVEIVADLILQNRVAPQAAAEALRCLGEMRDEATREPRRELLERSLACPSHVIRDGAVVGLSNMRDPRTAPALEAAATREDHALLRSNMLDLLEQLKEIQP